MICIINSTGGEKVLLEPLDPKSHYVFWTGGFDSTFRICQLLHDPYFQKTITPIYIVNSRVDGDTGRNNREKEIKTMNNLRNKIMKRFPYAKKRLLPTIYIDYVDFNFKKEYVDTCMKALVDIGCATRMHTQYRTMAIITLQHGIIAEVGTEGRETGAVTKYLLPYLENGYRFRKDAPSHFSIFTNIRWPLSLYKKQDMLEEAKKDNYSEILSSTFSCWFPEGDEPCGECKMCKERLKKI